MPEKDEMERMKHATTGTTVAPSNRLKDATTAPMAGQGTVSWSSGVLEVARCRWTLGADQYWDASCGGSHQFDVSCWTPSHYLFVYCPFCGKEIEEKKA